MHGQNEERSESKLTDTLVHLHHGVVCQITYEVGIM